jgi:hypothetical protein
LNGAKPRDPVYLRFSKKPVAKTEARARGEVNLDLDAHNGVVGIEMVSTDPDEWEAVARVGKEHDLRFDLLLAGAKKRKGAA